MPYNMLLAEDLRTAMGVRLEGNVVVFDEAHNLVDVSTVPLLSSICFLRCNVLALTGSKSYVLCEHEFNGDQDGRESGSDILRALSSPPRWEKCVLFEPSACSAKWYSERSR